MHVIDVNWFSNYARRKEINTLRQCVFTFRSNNLYMLFSTSQQPKWLSMEHCNNPLEKIRTFNFFKCVKFGNSLTHFEFYFQHELWPGIKITIQCGIVTRGHNSTWNFDPGSYFYFELWLRVIIPRWNVIPGHDSMLKSDPGSWFNIEIWP